MNQGSTALKLVSLVIFIALASANFCVLSSQDLYDINSINTIRITFRESNWNDILNNLKLAGNEERLMGSVEVNGERFDSVGVRYKGNSSYRPVNKKNPLNIKLDYVINGQKYQGYGTLKLSNGFKDPTMVREVLSYEIARKYMPASKANYARVYINDTYIGLYTSQQDVDKYFMRSHFGSDGNSRFKGEISGIHSDIVTWGYLGTDTTLYHAFYEMDSDQGWGDLLDFLDVLNNHTENVTEVLNVDRHLWMLAYDILMVNLDAPVNFAHNYYLYQDDAGRFNPIIWDMNENFGVFVRLLSNNQALTVEMLQQLDPFLHSQDPRYPIIGKILSNVRYKKIFIAHMKTMIDEIFSNNWYITRSLELQSLIDSEVQADPNYFYTYSDFRDNVYSSVTTSMGGPGSFNIVGLKELMEARVEYLESLSEFSAVAPSISNIEHSPGAISAGTEVWITAEIQDADVIELAYRHNSMEVFTKVEMHDDGAHEDGAAGDGKYGAGIKASSSTIQYYVYAENTLASAFSPARAAYEFYTIPVHGDVVINEFLASNNRSAVDQDGEYNDWIELYNNSDGNIDVAGYFLTDDHGNLTRWMFPDTTIKANDFLIVWADKDSTQDGLHAGFKLSASGECLMLLDADTVVIDELIFGEQSADISTGRYPNGVGDFILMDPTIAAENKDYVTEIKQEEVTILPGMKLHQNYPNPFSVSTRISFILAEEGRVRLDIFDMYGHCVEVLQDDYFPAGQHSVLFNAGTLPEGIYFYRITKEGKTMTGKAVLAK